MNDDIWNILILTHTLLLIFTYSEINLLFWNKSLNNQSLDSQNCNDRNYNNINLILNENVNVMWINIKNK